MTPKEVIQAFNKKFKVSYIDGLPTYIWSINSTEEGSEYGEEAVMVEDIKYIVWWINELCVRNPETKREVKAFLKEIK